MEKLTNKWYKISIDVCTDNSIYTTFDIFWEWMLFRFGGTVSFATSEELKYISDYAMENALGFDDLKYFDKEERKELKEQAKDIKKKYWIYPISTYEHGNFAFRLSYWNMLRWGDGVLFLDKNIFTKKWTNKQVDEFLRWNFTDFFNGWMYNVTIEKPHVYKDDDWNEITLWDYVDSICGVFIENLDDTYKEYFGEFWTYEGSLSNLY